MDAIYGDPKTMSNAVTQEIVGFHPIREKEDGRFCDFYHLINRSFNY
jgi:hypothetical protein